MEPTVHYQANICGGDFQHVRDCFNEWKRQPLVCRSNHSMFEGKQEVRPLSDRAFSDGEAARHVLKQTCDPRDPHALAVEIRDGERGIRLVMAAYEE